MVDSWLLLSKLIIRTYHLRVYIKSKNISNLNKKVSTLGMTAGEPGYLQSEVLVRSCSLKKVFLKISQNSQENTCVRVTFIVKFFNKRDLVFELLF